MYLIVALLFAITVALFAVQNAAPVDINFLIYQFKGISLVVVILISVLFGSLIVFLLSMVKQVSLMKRIYHLEKRKQSLEAELEKLREKNELPRQEQAAPEEESAPDAATS